MEHQTTNTQAWQSDHASITWKNQHVVLGVLREKSMAQQCHAPLNLAGVVVFPVGDTHRVQNRLSAEGYERMENARALCREIRVYRDTPIHGWPNQAERSGNRDWALGLPVHSGRDKGTGLGAVPWGTKQVPFTLVRQEQTERSLLLKPG